MRGQLTWMRLVSYIRTLTEDTVTSKATSSQEEDYSSLYNHKINVTI